MMLDDSKAGHKQEIEAQAHLAITYLVYEFAIRRGRRSQQWL